MKAQGFFGGTKPTDHAATVRQVGHTGKVQSKTGQLPRKTIVKQARPSAQPSTMARKTRATQVGSKGRAC